MYVPLRGHSTFSFLEALGQPKDIINCAKDLGLTAIAITDYNGMFGIPAFYLASKDSKNADNPDDNGVKAIFGMEMGFTMDVHSSLAEKNSGNLCLLAKNEIGYHNMMELVAFANQTGFTNGVPKLDLNILEEKSEGIIVFTGGETSWIAKMLLNGELESKILEIYEMLYKIFGDNCYLEITAQDESNIPGIKKCNHFIYNLAQKTNTKLIVNNDYHYLRKSDKDSWLVALSIKDGTKIYDSNRRNPQGEYHIMDGEEIRKICIKNGYPEDEIDMRLNNNGSIADDLNVSLLFNQKLFPKYEIKEDIKQLYDKYGDTSIGD